MFEIAAGVPFLIVTVVLPVLTVAARDDHARLVYMTGRIMQVMTVGGILVALLLWVLAEPILLVLGGSEYEPAGPVLQIQGFAAISVFVAAAWQPALFGLGHVRALAVALAVGIVALLIAGLVLIPPLDAEGAAIAAVIGDVTLCVSVYVVLQRALPAQWIPFAPFARTLVAAAGAVAVGLLPGLPDGARAVAVVAVFGALVLALRVLPSEVIDAAKVGLTRVRARGSR